VRDTYGVTATYSFPSVAGGAIRISTGLSAPEYLLLTINDSTWRAAGAAKYADLLFQLSLGLGVTLGRTVVGGFDAAVREEEITGSVTSLDWFQFFSKEIASRWPIETLETGPFTRLLIDDSGAVGIALDGTPFAPKGRPAAAAHLGIELRPILAVNPVREGTIRIGYD
jgi:hypothetical protein